MRTLALLACVPATLSASLAAQPRPPIPTVVLSHMNSLDARCKSAGGREGSRRYVIAQDFNGDGVLDYLLSEGDYDCLGRSALFRQNDQARVDIFVTDRTNAARRVYSDVLIGYRVLSGTPPKVQIARKGAGCGAGSSPATQCAAQLVWNGQGFGEAVSVDNASRTARAPSAQAVPGSTATPPTSETAWKAQCRADLLRRDAGAARWADDECKGRWQNIMASGPAAEVLLQVLPTATGAPATTVEFKRTANAVHWAAKASPPALASGQLGELAVSIEGRGKPAAVAVSWSQVGAEIPFDVVEAMRQRGATLIERSCEKTGVGAGIRYFAGSAPGKLPFALTIEQQTAPLGHMQSYYIAKVSLDGRQAPRGSLAGCDF